MKNYLLPLALIISSSSFAGVVTVTRPDSTNLLLETSKVTQKELAKLADEQHYRSSYCGGFVASFTGEVFTSPVQQKSLSFLKYTVDREKTVNSYLEEVKESRLLSNIQWFSSYPSRFYLSSTGVKAMTDLAEKWRALVRHLPHAKVELITHTAFEQPSVVLTLKGESDKIIVVGGHGDSINTDSSDKNAHAPGADDNASGISVITEVIQVLATKNHKPQNTLKFMAYAAEEVGLLGSMEISKNFLTAKNEVLGVIQFDGTNYRGSKDLAMVLIEDHTHVEQNKFLGKLIDTYLKVPWSYETCGYACSDHYSWTYRGFAASFPAEARIKEENPKIHTAKDTLAVSDNNASHSVNFSKLGLAFVIELDR